MICFLCMPYSRDDCLKVAAVGQQLNGMAEALVKYLARRDEYDEVGNNNYRLCSILARRPPSNITFYCFARMQNGARPYTLTHRKKGLSDTLSRIGRGIHLLVLLIAPSAAAAAVDLC